MLVTRCNKGKKSFQDTLNELYLSPVPGIPLLCPISVYSLGPPRACHSVRHTSGLPNLQRCISSWCPSGLWEEMNQGPCHSLRKEDAAELYRPSFSLIPSVSPQVQPSHHESHFSAKIGSRDHYQKENERYLWYLHVESKPELLWALDKPSSIHTRLIFNQ